MKDINWKVSEDRLIKDRFVATLEDENSDLVDWMVGSFETVRNYIGKQMKEVDRFSVAWPDGHVSTYLSIKFAS